MWHNLTIKALFFTFLLLNLASEAQFLFFKKKKAIELNKTQKQDVEYTFSEGMKEYILENYGKAVHYFEKSLQANPTSAATNYMLAQIYFKQRNWYKAQSYSEKALQLNDQNKYYYQLLAQIYEQKQDFNEAIKIYQALLKKIPNTVEFNYELGSMYLTVNKFDDALKCYDKIEKVYGMSEEITTAKQQILLKNGKLDEALKEGKKLIDAFPDESRYVMLQVELLLNNEKYDDALKLVNQLLVKEPENAFGILALSDIYRAKGDTNQSNKLLMQAFKNPNMNMDAKLNILVSKIRQLPNDGIKKQCLELGKELVKSHPTDSRSHAVYADILAIDTQNKEALQSYLKSIKLDNTQYKIWQQINVLDHELQLYDSMMVHSEKALEVFPNQNIFWFYNGLAYQMKKDYKKSTVAFEEGRKLSLNDRPMLLQFITMLGDSYNGAKDYKKSDEAFEEVLRLDNDNHLVMNNYSYYLSVRKERLDYAKKLSEKVIKEYPDNATYLDTYAWILYALKDYKAAADIFEKIVDKSDNATIVEHYGDVLYQLGKKEQALSYWKKAKEMGEISEFLDRKITDNKLYE